MCFFFFKQTKAYEVRISDWSSDVGSSDLEAVRAGELEVVLPEWSLPQGIAHAVFASRRGMLPAVRVFIDFLAERLPELIDQSRLDRSEEHTSELQSLMRLSYAVFGLKKKNKTEHETCPTAATKKHKECPTMHVNNRVN